MIATDRRDAQGRLLCCESDCMGLATHGVGISAKVYCRAHFPSETRMNTRPIDAEYFRALSKKHGQIADDLAALPVRDLATHMTIGHHIARAESFREAAEYLQAREEA